VRGGEQQGEGRGDEATTTVEGRESLWRWRTLRKEEGDVSRAAKTVQR
jgi:hypothetical protein